MGVKIHRSVFLITAVTLAATSLAYGLQRPMPAAAEPESFSLAFQYDCDAAPWRCDGARAERRYQVWAVRCGSSGCFWRWESRANPGVTIDLTAGGRYRLHYAGDNDFDNLGEFRYSGCSGASVSVDEVCLEVFYQCNRYPFLYDGTNAWQRYSCHRRADGSCRWVWEEEMVGNSTGVYEILPIDNYLLFWGPPRGYATPTPTATSTLVPTATPTQTSTPTPTATLTPSPTPEPTETPSPTPVPTDTLTATATRFPTRAPTATETEVPPPTASATATHSPAPTTTPRQTIDDNVLYLPRVLRHCH